MVEIMLLFQNLGISVLVNPFPFVYHNSILKIFAFVGNDIGITYIQIVITPRGKLCNILKMDMATP